MSDLTLYKFDACPFCAKVARFMQANNLNIETKDILLEPANRQELIQIGGRSTVPCLVIDGKAMYESNDIIAYMRENLLT